MISTWVYRNCLLLPIADAFHRLHAHSVIAAGENGGSAGAHDGVTTIARQTHAGDMKRAIGNASILSDGRAVFNIAGNRYRILVWINYPYRVVSVRFIGTHRQYNRIDAQTI